MGRRRAGQSAGSSRRHQIWGALKPRLAPSHCWRASWMGCCAAIAISSKKGVSLKTSSAISPSPQGSRMVCQSGGRSNPVSAGETSRSSQPEGASKKAKPMAKATWGMASMGESRRRSSPKARLSLWASSRAVISRLPRVEAVPIHRLSAAECHRPGWASSKAR